MRQLSEQERRQSNDSSLAPTLTKEFNMNKLLIASILGAAVAGTPAIASANRIWTSVGDGCVPMDESAGLYDQRGFGVGFLAGKTGQIRLVCPVTVNTSGSSTSSPTFSGIVISYRDSDGTGTAARVRATLNHVTDGSNASVAVCTADSNTNSSFGYTTTTCGLFPALVPQTNESWYFEILIDRTVTSVDPEVLAVSIN